MGLLRIVLLLWLSAAQAEAGAWARGKGNGFASLSYTLSVDPATLGASTFEPQGYLSLLLEYGLGERLTFGLDAGQADDGDYRAVTYLSRNFGPAGAANRFALHLGAGLSRNGGTDEPLAYLGASWGRGFETRLGSGWAALDGALYYRAGNGGLVTKADLTVGLKPTERLKLFVQLQGGRYPGSGPYLRVVPSVAYGISRRAHLEMGVAVGITEPQRLGLKLGTWLEF